MLLLCVGSVHSLNTSKGVKIDVGGTECGYHSCNSLEGWYMDESQKNTMVEHWESIIKDIPLNRDTSTTNHINTFELYVHKLEKLEVSWTDGNKI